MNKAQAWYNGWAVMKLGGPGSGHHGHGGRPGERGGSVPGGSLAVQAGGVPASNILDIDSLPKALKGLASKAAYKPQVMMGKTAHAAGLAPKTLGDGSLLIPVAEGRKPSKRILIHEIVHAHQSQVLASDPNRHDALSREFETRAMLDNKSAKSPLWADDMLKNGDEIWAEAAGFYYGGVREMVVSASPEVTKLVRDEYE